MAGLGSAKERIEQLDDGLRQLFLRLAPGLPWWSYLFVVASIGYNHD